MKNNPQLKKEFDSVDMMRNIRNQLIETYSKNPNQEKVDLENIRKKYNLKIPSENRPSNHVL